LYPEPRRSVVLAVVFLYPESRRSVVLAVVFLYQQNTSKNNRSPRLWIQAKQQQELLISLALDISKTTARTTIS
jgi:hypothetical protein